VGDDQLVVIGTGGGVRGLRKGSDSPSKTAGFVSWSNDMPFGSRLRVGRLIGPSRTIGHCKEVLE